LVIGTLTSVILIVLGTVNLQFQKLNYIIIKGKVGRDAGYHLGADYWKKKKNFPGGPVVKKLPSNTGNPHTLLGTGSAFAQ